MIPPDAWPAGDLLEWADDETRTHHDFLNETTRPYSDEENAVADKLAAERAASDDRAALTEQARNFLDIEGPTEAQVLAQVRALTRLWMDDSHSLTA